MTFRNIGFPIIMTCNALWSASWEPMNKSKEINYTCVYDYILFHPSVPELGGFSSMWLWFENLEIRIGILTSAFHLWRCHWRQCTLAVVTAYLNTWCVGDWNSIDHLKNATVRASLHHQNDRIPYTHTFGSLIHQKSNEITTSCHTVYTKKKTPDCSPQVTRFHCQTNMIPCSYMSTASTTLKEPVWAEMNKVTDNNARHIGQAN